MLKKSVISIVILTVAAMVCAQADWSAYMYPANMLSFHEEDNYVLFGSAMGMVQIDKQSYESEILTTANYVIDTNYINAISKDAEGNLWIGHVHNWADGEGAGGITVVHPDGTTTRYTMENSDLPGHLISDIEFDDNGLVWISFGFRDNEMGGIATFNPETDEWNHYNKINSELNANTVLDLLKASDGTIWAALMGDYDMMVASYVGGGVCKLGSEDWVMYDTELCEGPVGYTGAEAWEVQNLAQDSQGNIWFALRGDLPVATDKQGLYKIEDNDVSYYQDYAGNYSDYWSVAVDNDDKVWVTACASTIGYYADGSWTTFDNFGSYYIQRIFTDSDNQLWISLYESGLYKTDVNEINFTQIDYSYDNCPIKYNFMHDICATDAGEVYFSTGWYPYGGINSAFHSLLYTVGGAWNAWGYGDFQNYIVNETKPLGGSDLLLATGVESADACAIYQTYGGVTLRRNNQWIVHNLYTGYPYLSAETADMDGNGNIWAGSWGAGLTVYDGYEWTEFHPANSPLVTNAICDILCLPGTNDVWVSTMGSLFLIDASDLNNLQWDEFEPDNSNFTTGAFRHLFLDDEDQLWACTATGLFRYDGYQWISYQNTLGLIGAQNMTQDECGRYWIATDTDGIVMMDGDMVSFFDAESTCLPSNTINCIASDKNGHLWVNPHASGIYCYEYQVTSSGNVELVPVNAIQHQNYPNPFNPETTISFDLPMAGDVEVAIFNAKGQKVCTLANEEMQAGAQSLQWNGKDANDQPVASGMYFYKINFNGNSYSDKMMLLK